MNLRRSIFGLMMILVMFGSTTQAQDAATPRRLLFVSERDGNREIYVVNDDGTDVQNLTNNAADDAYPAWSPDGSQIALQSDREGVWNIYTMDADGSNVRAWSGGGAQYEHPTWYYLESERNLIYQTRESDGDWNIGMSGEAVTSASTNDVTPIASPDYHYVGFRAQFTTQWQLQLLVLNDGAATETRQLTPPGTNVGTFSWSPDSQFIAFERNGEIYSVDVNGNLPPINLTLSDAYDSSPAWSPAGNQIAYVSNWEIYTMDSAAGSNPYNLSQNPAYDISPAWSPDAQQVAFASFRDANWEIYAMNSDGCNVRRLTNDQGWDGLPQWQPQQDISATTIERAPTAILTTPSGNLRSGPGENHTVVATAAQRECFTISGRSTDGAWLQIQYGDTLLWVSLSIVEIVGDLTNTPITQP